MKTLSLRIEAAGLCCAVGYQLDAAECALRANMDHFQESDFLTQGGEPIRVARLPDNDRWGAQRIAQWIKLAVHDCLQGVADFDASQVPLIVLCPTQDRPMVNDDWCRDTYRFAEKAIGLQFDERSAILPGGRAGFAQALQLAHSWFSQSTLERVLLVGADSYIDSASINHYLSQGRLLVTGNRDGFLPGEAAAALLLTRGGKAAGLHIDGVGVAQEAGRPDGSVPSRAQALGTAIRQACQQAGIEPSQLQFRMSDQNGEAFFAREAANALTRVMWGGGPQLPVLTTADCIGEVGAATGPVMLAYLSRLQARTDGPGPIGLVHLANDNGLRGAVISHYRAAQP